MHIAKQQNAVRPCGIFRRSFYCIKQNFFVDNSPKSYYNNRAYFIAWGDFVINDDVKTQLSQLDCLLNRCTNLYHPLAERFGISDTTLDILCGINQLGRPCTQKELCSIWYLSKQTVNSCIKQLSAKGLAETKPSPNSQKEKLITLTPKGADFCRRTAGRVYSAECSAFAALSQDERKQLVLLTKKHIDFMEKEFEKILENDV